MPTKTVTFDSIYKTNYAIVEEKDRCVSLYPHTDQLPVILDAINREFRKHLPHEVAQVAGNSSNLDKYVLRASARIFCNFFNRSRSDQLQFYPIYDRNLVSHLAVVQKITEHTPKGPVHHFKFYTGPGFFQEFYVAGRRLLFVEHCFERFLERTAQPFGVRLNDFFQSCLSVPYLVLDCNHGTAFVFSTPDRAVIVCPFEDTGTEFIVKTTLSAAQTGSLRRSLPAHHYYLSYDRNFTLPSFVEPSPRLAMEQRVYQWEREVASGHNFGKVESRTSWEAVAPSVRQLVRKDGYGPGMTLRFCSGVFGPCATPTRQGELANYDELADYERICPGHDWKVLLAQRDQPGYRLDKNKISIAYKHDPGELLIEQARVGLDKAFSDALDSAPLELGKNSASAPTFSLEVATDTPYQSKFRFPKAN